MNSSLQCLMHTVPLLPVFLARDSISPFEQSIYRGEVVGAFQSLTGMVWQV